MDETKFELFAPFAKIDERTGEFEAWATLEEIDASGEIIDIDKSWPYFQALADQFSKNTGGVNFGPLREQHDPAKASGHLIAPPVLKTREDGVRGILINGVPTDPITKDKMIRKTLTGISIGGSYVGAKEDVVINGHAAKKFVANPNHYAPVDSPCVKGALVTMVKADGHEVQELLQKEVRQFWDCLNNAAHRHERKDEALKCDAGSPVAKIEAEEPETLEKISAETRDALPDSAFALPDRRYPIDTKPRAKAALARVSEYGTAAEQKKVGSAVKEKYPDLNTGGDDVKTAKSDASGDLSKSLWNVSTLTSLLTSLLCVISDEEYEETWETIDAMREGKEPDAAGMSLVIQLKQLASATFDAIEAMLAEERAELDDAVYGELAMSLVAGALSKSPTAKQLIKSLRVPRGNGSTVTKATEPKETPMSEATTPVVPPAKEAATPAPETAAKALACNDPINPHMHEGGICKAELITPENAPVMKALSGIAAKLDDVVTKRDAESAKFTELEDAVGKLAKGVAFLLGQPAEPQGALRATAAVEKATDAAPETVTQTAATTVAKSNKPDADDPNGVMKSIAALTPVIAKGMKPIGNPLSGSVSATP